MDARIDAGKSALWLLALILVAFAAALALLAESWAPGEPSYAPAERGTVAVSDVAAPSTAAAPNLSPAPAD